MSFIRRFQTVLQKHFALAWLILSSITLFGLLRFLARSPQLVELWYSRGLYKWLTRVLSSLSATLPFSLSEISLYLAILAALFWIVRGIWRRRFLRSALELLAGVTVLVLWFYFAWGFNYFRPKIEQQLQLAKVEPDSLTLRENLLWCIESANETWQPLSMWNLRELNDEIERSYSKVYQEMSLPPISGRWPPKFPVIPATLDYTLTSGIFGPFFHEVHLNSHLLPMEMPIILAHEKAHGRGFARESEASFLAVLVCLRSPNRALHYSAYFSLIGPFMARYHRFANTDSLTRLIRPEVIADFDSVQSRIEKYMGRVAGLSQKGYDLYLRANKVEGGVENYTDVVDLVIRWRGSHKAF
ncbi:MAG: DUF3810 domain-containing protein [candidate division KSB1 bacterium]|nr:DUF3810 domain-containing protein [candidate division KSB1 bacterium]